MCLAVSAWVPLALWDRLWSHQVLLALTTCGLPMSGDGSAPVQSGERELWGVRGGGRTSHDRDVPIMRVGHG